MLDFYWCNYITLAPILPITALLKQNGAVSEKYSYDAYVRRRNPTNWNDYNVPAPTLINRGYTGHEMLDGFGLINMNGRMYDPVIGRILSPDPFVSSSTNTQSYNRYSYCLNNPLRYTDPSGYNEHPADWGMEPYFPLAGFDIPWMSGACGPGSGNHWSDQLRSVYGNFMTMSSTSFQDYYGISSIDYNSNIVPNYKDLPHFSHDFKTNSSGEFGFFVQYDAGVAKNDGKSNNGAVDIDGANIGGRFVIIRGTHNLNGGIAASNTKNVGGDWINTAVNILALGATSGYIIGFEILRQGKLNREIAGTFSTEVKSSARIFKTIGKFTGIASAFISWDDYFNNPTTGGHVKAWTNTGLVFIRVNPFVGIGLGILDLTGGSDWIYNQIGNGMESIGGPGR